MKKSSCNRNMFSDPDPVSIGGPTQSFEVDIYSIYILHFSGTCAFKNWSSFLVRLQLHRPK